MGGSGARHRMFVAVMPPEQVREELERFLEPRPGLAWTSPSQWHLTLTFCPEVDEWRIDDLIDRLAAVARKHEPFRLRLAGAGAFPSVERAKVLWAAVEQGPVEHGADEQGPVEQGQVEHCADEHGAYEHGADEHGSVEHGVAQQGAAAGSARGTQSLHALAAGARSAANAAGCVPDGARFRPHLTLARLRGREDATAWLRVLDTFGSSEWTADEIALVDSFLGDGPGGRARHEVVARLPLGRTGLSRPHSAFWS